eukprot:TRINITY_DN8048_c0_g3_i3.p1 TRINITY_DN8048_c0_g3~~TRINITY_DN8048_c0_g3_i3.p1  ORF type:complete len:477 (-),score=63.29 TRINITY_DN8048_c0_g3_i3:70-1500(-)
MKRTKIIATIGPACENEDMLEKMIKAGMNVCRLNFSFGSHEEHLAKIKMIRNVATRCEVAITIMQDLQGPKIRVGKLKNPVTVKVGDIVTLSGNSEHKDELYLPTTYSGIASDTEPGKTILMADGRIMLNVMEVHPERKEAVCKVSCGGTILTGKGINLPYTRIALPALTEKDREDAIFGLKAGVDAIALSFVRSAEDVMVLRSLMDELKVNVPVIAKLEKPEALDFLKDILDTVDGVMVARGDLADEISFPKVPVAQKRIIHEANKKGKLTIVATEMLGSMIENPLPSRAEVSDVANAVLDGADMIMLSNESAIGRHPDKVVSTMAEIAIEAESIIPQEDYMKELDLAVKHELTEALCMATSFLTHDLNEKLVAVLTSSGETARILAKCRPESVICAATFDENVFNQMAMLNNVYPIMLKTEFNSNPHEAYKQLEVELRHKNFVHQGDRCIVLAGKTTGKENKKWELNSIHVVTL